jgi:hypothetical protein
MEPLDLDADDDVSKKSGKVRTPFVHMQDVLDTT